ncbi:MAG: DUF1365 domain-containing protein [Solirubrobacteraceae bacterium]
MSISCIYEGTVRHRRTRPRRELSDRLALLYLDLDELPRLLGGRLVSRRPGLVRFRRSDYLGDRRIPLRDAVLDVVHAHTGTRPEGPIRVLTHPRSFGHCFNPVSFYYCYDGPGERIEALVAEVTNTPWGERHAYVVPSGGQEGAVLRGDFAKALHVSPFMGMDHHYTCAATTPAQTLSVRVESARGGERAFDATLSLRRRELTWGSLAAISVRHPFPTLRVLALIYRHAVGLRLAGARVFPHPDGAGT